MIYMFSTVPNPHSFNRYLLSILYVLDSMISTLHGKQSENGSCNYN